MGKKRREWNELKLEDFQGFLEEFQRESDRAAPVLGAAYLDESLRQLIAASLIDKPTEVDELLGPTGPLRSFSSRIGAAYCMGLISEDEYDDLRSINSIRIRFAHDLHGLRFTDEWAKKECASLRSAKEELAVMPSLSGARNRFNVTISILSAQLKLRLLRQQGIKHPDVATGFRLAGRVK